jgi:hypothetical protein
MGYFKTELGLETPEPGNAPTITGDLKKLAEQVDALLRKQVTTLVELAKLKVTEKLEVVALKVTGTLELPVASITGAMVAPSVGGAAVKSIVTTEQARENATYGALATPDEVTVTLPENGLIVIAYQAAWKESIAATARASIFIGPNPLRFANQAEAELQEAKIGGEANHFSPLATGSTGLYSPKVIVPTNYSGDATTGQAIGVFGAENGLESKSQIFGGTIAVFAAAGTYKISVQFKASSGKVTVKNRKLWAWVVG